MRPQNLFPGFGRRKSGASSQKAEVREPNWRENFWGGGGPRSKAAVALRGPLSRVRVIRVFDGDENGQKGGRVARKEVDRIAQSEKRWK